MDQQKLMVAGQALAMATAKAAGRAQIALQILKSLITVQKWERYCVDQNGQRFGDALVVESLRLADLLIDLAAKDADAGDKYMTAREKAAH